MNEEFLHYIWQHRLFDKNNLQTTNNEKIQVLNPGILNKNAGPDFFNARIKIGEILWSGNVEIHVKSSNWKQHKHHKDKAYDSVILQIVSQNDTDTIKNTVGKEIPTAKLSFNQQFYQKYCQLIEQEKWIACEDILPEIDDFLLKNWLANLLFERLEQKIISIKELFDQNTSNWENTFYQILARSFGFKVNALPFEMVAKSLPIIYLAKHKNNLQQIEAMFFGQAGMLNEPQGDEYYLRLKKEYQFLKHKFSLQNIEKHLWKFARLRPANFPTIRIAQFANLIHRSSGLFSKILETETLQKYNQLFTIKTSEYWDTHYQFNKTSTKRKKTFGQTAFNTIMINTIVPFLFFYGKMNDSQKYIDKAINLLEKIDAENNTIIKKWTEKGIKVQSASDTQALLQLKNEYCSQKRCIECRIGNQYISK